jgi:hypothetical protein
MIPESLLAKLEDAVWQYYWLLPQPRPSITDFYYNSGIRDKLFEINRLCRQAGKGGHYEN